MRIVFFGTPTFAATILSYLLEQGVEIAAVVSRPDKPKGRSKKLIPTPVKELALAHNLPLYQPERVSEPSFCDFLKTLDADLFVVAAFAEIFKESVLAIPKFGSLNVHASLLPKYRGAAPIQRCIMAGEQESGVTIMLMEKALDAGGMLAMAKTEIPEEMTAGELTEVLAEIGAKALWPVMQEVVAQKAHPIQQDEGAVSYAKKLKAEDGQIDWNRPCDEVYNHIRGVTPKPGAWVWASVRGEKKRLKIKKALKAPSKGGKPGEILSENRDKLFVCCRSGAVELLEIQLEGKRALAASDFLRGFGTDNLKF